MLKKAAKITFSSLGLIIGFIIVSIYVIWELIRHPTIGLKIIAGVIIWILSGFSKYVGGFGARLGALDDLILWVVKSEVDERKIIQIRDDIEPALSQVGDVGPGISKRGLVQYINWVSVSVEREFRRGEFGLSILIALAAMTTAFVPGLDEIVSLPISLGPYSVTLNGDQIIQLGLFLLLVTLLLSVAVRTTYIDLLAYRDGPPELRPETSRAKEPSVFHDYDKLGAMWQWNLYFLGKDTKISALVLMMATIEKIGTRTYQELIDSLHELILAHDPDTGVERRSVTEYMVGMGDAVMQDLEENPPNFPGGGGAEANESRDHRQK